MVSMGTRWNSVINHVFANWFNLMKGRVFEVQKSIDTNFPTLKYKCLHAATPDSLYLSNFGLDIKKYHFIETLFEGYYNLLLLAFKVCFSKNWEALFTSCLVSFFMTFLLDNNGSVAIGKSAFRIDWLIDQTIEWIFCQEMDKLRLSPLLDQL